MHDKLSSRAGRQTDKVKSTAATTKQGRRRRDNKAGDLPTKHNLFRFVSSVWLASPSYVDSMASNSRPAEVAPLRAPPWTPIDWLFGAIWVANLRIACLERPEIEPICVALFLVVVAVVGLVSQASQTSQTSQTGRLKMTKAATLMTQTDWL